jgi:hypothetical protein
MIDYDAYTGLGRYELCLDPSPPILFSCRRSKRSSSGSSFARIPHRRRSVSVPELSWLPTTIPTGVISSSVGTLEPPIGSCASGGAAGSKPSRSPMQHGRAHLGVFPLRCAPKSRQPPVVCRALACRVAAACPLAAVSSSTVGRWLLAEKIRPWRYRSWQHIHDRTAFLVRARPVLRLYAQARPLLQEGAWVVCVDEKTSIQARQAEQAPRPARGRHCARHSPRYKRHGAGI